MENILEARKISYIFFSNQYEQTLTVDDLFEIFYEDVFNNFPLDLDNENYKEGVLLLEGYADENKQNYKKMKEKTMYDYNRLFIGPAKVLAPPWESVHTTKEKLVFSEPTIAVRAFYKEHGLVFNELNKEPEDHFSIELEFMAFLIDQQITAENQGINEKTSYYLLEQKRFMKNHLGKWYSIFLDAVYKNAQTKYYQGLALCTKGFLQWDEQYLYKNIPKN